MGPVFSIILHLDGRSLILNSKDIVECYFIEDIFSFSLVGKLIFHDMYGIVEMGPLTGNEQIILEYGIDEDRQIAFDIWKIERIAQTNATQPTSESLVEIHFVDKSFEYFTKRKFSRSFTSSDDNIGKTSDIVKLILEYMIGNPNIGRWEDSIDVMDFIMPYWTPIQSIMWLSKRCTGKDSGMPGYLCYNSTEAEPFRTNYITLDKLFGNYVTDKKHYEFGEDDIYKFEDNCEGYKRKTITEWWINGIDKSSFSSIKGKKVFGYNITKKELLSNSYTYSDTIPKVMLFGKKSLFADISDNRTGNTVTSEDNSEDMDKIYYSNWIKRYSLQQVLNIILPGHETRYAGKQIEIAWPSTDPKSNLWNKQMKGKYLIKTVTHMLTSDGSNLNYRQRLVLLKNAYVDIDDKELIKSTRRNIKD